MKVECESWESWLGESLDRESVEVVRELFRAALAMGESTGCFFHLLGPPASGKTTLVRVLASLVGELNVRRLHPYEVRRDVRGIGFEKRLLVLEDALFTKSVVKRVRRLLRDVVFDPTGAEQPEREGVVLVVSEGEFDLSWKLGMVERRVVFQRGYLWPIEMDDVLVPRLVSDRERILRWVEGKNGKGGAA